MTPIRFIFVVLLPLLVGCKLLPEAQVQPTQSSSAQTELATDVLPQPAAAKIRPKPRPPAPSQAVVDGEVASVSATEAPVVDPVDRKTKAQVTCEKQGGNWDEAGKTGAKTCFKRTGDAGKQCRKQSTCESVCLARSGTCAPVKPLFGCNDILQDDGSRVTLCVD